MEPSNFVDVRMARSPRYFLLPQDDINMRVPDTVRKCVLMLGCQDEMTGEIVYGGTGFIVTIPGKSRDWKATYLVTAKHSLEKIGNRKTVLRANSSTGPIEIDATGAKWYFHPDPVVDLAVIPFLPSLDLDIQIRSISEQMFLTQEDIAQHRIGSGDEVFMTGLFTKVKGQSKNLPIVRMGTVALIPDEQIPFDNNLIDAYLIESRSIGGLSGSPAFVSATVQLGYPSREPGAKYPEDAKIYFVPGQTFFMGLVIGHWDVPPSLSLLEKEKVNMGISVVIPAWKIKELLYLPEHVNMREEAEKLALEEEGVSSTDFVEPKPLEKFTQADFEAALKKVSRKRSDQK